MKVVFLDGREGCDIEGQMNVMKEAGHEVFLIDNLYEEPEKIKGLDNIMPDALYLATTATYADKVREVFPYFLKLEYKPKKVIFFSENTTMFFLSTAREFKEKYGTEFYYYHAAMFGEPEEFFKIPWV